MDSIVDSFFPFLENIEKEVAAIESLVFSTNASGEPADRSSLEGGSSSSITVVGSSPKLSTGESKEDLLSMKQEDTIHSIGAKTHFSLPPPPRRTWRLFLGYIQPLKRMIPFRSRTQEPVPSETTSTVHRMARTRRLVTSLTRVLAAKSEVVTQLKKRLLMMGGIRGGIRDDKDVFIYMGDVQGMCSSFESQMTN